MALVNIKDAKNIFLQNVLYNMYDFMQKIVHLKTKKNDFSWVFTERVTNVQVMITPLVSGCFVAALISYEICTSLLAT